MLSSSVTEPLSHKFPTWDLIGFSIVYMLLQLSELSLFIFLYILEQNLAFQSLLVLFYLYTIGNIYWVEQISGSERSFAFFFVYIFTPPSGM